MACIILFILFDFLLCADLVNLDYRMSGNIIDIPIVLANEDVEMVLFELCVFVVLSRHIYGIYVCM